MFTMRKPLPTFREHLAGDEPVFGVFSKTNDPFFIEILGKSGFDFVILDREHGPNSIRELYPLVMAAWLNDLYPVVRVGSLEESEVQRVLDLGVAGIQIPHIESAADAERARRFIRFHPQGSRGVCRFVRAAEFTAMDRGAYFAAQNEVASILMIEGSSGVVNAGAICQSPGHDVVFVGPYDLSQSLGIPGQVGDPRVTSLVESIVATCRASGATPAYLWTPSRLRGNTALSGSSTSPFLWTWAYSRTPARNSGLRCTIPQAMFRVNKQPHGLTVAAAQSPVCPPARAGDGRLGKRKTRLFSPSVEPAV
jgi:4-hydroxy-2-oxoheptanedioate aldolase